MTTNPIDPVFDPTSFPRGYGLSENGNSAGHGPQDATVDATNSELGAIAGAIEELQGRLAQAHEQLNQVAVVQTTEYEIGRLFVEAQRFSEASLSKLEMQIQEILVEAEAKAAEILREAHEDAAEIRRQAQQASSIPDRTAQELQTAIVGFASVNSELVKELTALNDMLTPTSLRRSDSSGYSADSIITR
jgi:cell division septum initiation protein DivIVA